MWLQLPLIDAVRRLKRLVRLRDRRSTTPRPRRASISVSDAQLVSIWTALRAHYFPERADLDSFLVCWSTRPQKRTLASCNIRRRKVVVASELRSDLHRRWLSPLLYHEMCHAVLGDTIGRRGGKRAWHGAEFKALERRNPEIAELDAWIRSGGWRHAVRSARSRAAWAARSAAGFTLIEVLVALLVLATSLVVLLGLQSSSTQAALRSRNQTTAMLYARSFLAAVESDEIVVPESEDTTLSLLELFDRHNLTAQISETERESLTRFTAHFVSRPKDILEYKGALQEIMLTISWGPSNQDSFTVNYYEPTESDEP